MDVFTVVEINVINHITLRVLWFFLVPILIITYITNFVNISPYITEFVKGISCITDITSITDFTDINGIIHIVVSLFILTL